MDTSPAVGVAEGVLVTVGVNAGVNEAPIDLVGVIDGVRVGVIVLVGVTVGVTVNVGVIVGVLVGVTVGVLVAVGVIDIDGVIVGVGEGNTNCKSVSQVYPVLSITTEDDGIPSSNVMINPPSNVVFETFEAYKFNPLLPDK